MQTPNDDVALMPASIHAHPTQTASQRPPHRQGSVGGDAATGPTQQTTPAAYATTSRPRGRDHDNNDLKVVSRLQRRIKRRVERIGRDTKRESMNQRAGKHSRQVREGDDMSRAFVRRQTTRAQDRLAMSTPLPELSRSTP
jgi:hypothetical protein